MRLCKKKFTLNVRALKLLVGLSFSMHKTVSLIAQILIYISSARITHDAWNDPFMHNSMKMLKCLAIRNIHIREFFHVHRLNSRSISSFSLMHKMNTSKFRIGVVVHVARDPCWERHFNPSNWSYPLKSITPSIAFTLHF